MNKAGVYETVKQPEQPDDIPADTADRSGEASESASAEARESAGAVADAG
jgi:hypothetical protein